VASLDGGAARRLMPAYSRVAYAAGHLLFVRDGRLLAQPFDVNSATLHGQPVALSARVKYHAASDGAFDVSESGVLLYGLTAGQVSTRLALMDRRGREVRTLTEDGAHRQPRFSPDGDRVAAERLNRDDSNSDIWVYGVKQPSEARLTNNDAPDVKPAWSPDGRRIAFSSKRGALFHVFTKQVDSTEPEQPLVITTAGDKFLEDWSADGRYMSGTVLGSGLWVMPLTSGEAPRQIRENLRAPTWQSEFSPDGHWLAYMSEESGDPEVYVEPFPGTGSRWQISTRGGAEPHWRGDGRELLYLGADGFLMSMMVPDSGWQHARPRPLFRVDVPDLGGSGDFAVSPDGELLVVNTFIADPVVPPVEVVVNWSSLLGR
jgi:dipeptidyl aminopeptidase/acylaminoacyl peptidase